MEESDDIEDYEFIPMKQCHQRSRSLPFNQFRQIPEVEKPRKSSAHPTFATSPNSHNSFKVRFLQNMSSTKLQVFKSITVFLQKNSALDIY